MLNVLIDIYTFFILLIVETYLKLSITIWFFPLIIPPSLNCTVLHSMVIVMVMVMVILIRVWYDFDTNEYLNIFVSRKWHKWIFEYIHMKFFDTTEYPNIFISKFWYERISEYLFGSKYLNIQIYSSHSGLDWHQFYAFTI